MDKNYIYQLAAALGGISQGFAPAGTNMGKLGQAATQFSQSAIQAEAEKKAKEQAEKEKKGALGGSIGGTLGSAALAAIPGVGPIASAGLAAAGGAAGSAAGSAIAGGGGAGSDPMMHAVQGAMGSIMSPGVGQTTGGSSQLSVGGTPTPPPTPPTPPPTPATPPPQVGGKSLTLPTTSDALSGGKFSSVPMGAIDRGAAEAAQRASQPSGLSQWWDNFKTLVPQYMEQSQFFQRVFDPNTPTTVQMQKDVNGDYHMR